MIYHIDELLKKMGAPLVREKGAMEWFYFGSDKKDLAGAAAIRLEQGGEKLVAELKHIKNDYTDDDGKKHARYAETFYLFAERTARPDHYRITSLAFDGESYEKPKKAIIEMGLAVFHAKALDISIAMVEQAFGKDEILDPVIDPKSQFRKFMQQKTAGISAARQSDAFRTRKETAGQNYGVVVPFPVRKAHA